MKQSIEASKSYFLKALSDLLDKSFGETLEVSVKSDVESETNLVKSVLVEERRALFVVLEPQEVDSTKDLHGDTYDEKAVEAACISFNTHCMKANLFHEVEIENAIIEQSFITPSEFTLEDGRVVQKGTWLQWWYFPEGDAEADLLWESVKSGTINGVSIGARVSYQDLGESDE